MHEEIDVTRCKGDSTSGFLEAVSGYEKRIECLGTFSLSRRAREGVRMFRSLIELQYGKLLRPKSRLLYGDSCIMASRSNTPYSLGT